MEKTYSSYQYALYLRQNANGSNSSIESQELNMFSLPTALAGNSNSMPTPPQNCQGSSFVPVDEDLRQDS